MVGRCEHYFSMCESACNRRHFKTSLPMSKKRFRLWGAPLIGSRARAGVSPSRARAGHGRHFGIPLQLAPHLHLFGFSMLNSVSPSRRSLAAQPRSATAAEWIKSLIRQASWCVGSRRRDRPSARAPRRILRVNAAREKTKLIEMPG